MAQGVSTAWVGVHQDILLKQLQNLFPDPMIVEEIYPNSKKDVSLKYSAESYMELDIWIPSYNLSFEFQDSYHYVTTWYHQNPIEKTQNKDTVLQRGITLIVIPCWWNSSVESLKSTINSQRPEIFSDCQADPIPLNPPPNFFINKDIPGVGELMLASFPTTSKFDVDTSPSKWWVGEKYDGIRCCWNSLQKTLFSRHAKELLLLPSILHSLPGIFIDGELWFGRGQFSLTQPFIQQNTSLVHWNFLRLTAFDVPLFNNNTLQFEDRYTHLLNNIPRDKVFAIVVARILSNSNLQLSSLMTSVLNDSGEGLIVRKKGSFYEHGRNLSLFKLKGYQGDEEALVVEVSEEFVKLELPTGKTFNVPMVDVGVENITIGDIITFSFESYSKRDLPVQPKILKKREDLSWEKIKDKSNTAPNENEGVEGFSSLPMGHWTKQTMVEFFKKIAKKRNLNPLDCETWYSMPIDVIRGTKGGSSILKKFQGGYFETIQYLFPDIGLKKEGFTRLPQFSWNKIENRKKFFEDYAKERGFDHLNPLPWYSQSVKQIIATKGGHGVFKYYKTLPQALLDVFPDIGLDVGKFPTSWRGVESRRMFFELYAKAHGFDPLIPDNWYEQHTKSILATKNAKEVLKFYATVSDALIDVFPNIGFDKSKFLSSWSNIENRKRFFILYSQKTGFDPQIPENWYTQPIKNIMKIKGAHGILNYHKSIPQALVDLFPNIGLQKSKFNVAPWSEKHKRRQFFENFANKQGFDPLEPKNWYNKQLKDLFSIEGIHGILSYHRRSVSVALSELFPDIAFDKNVFREAKQKHKVIH